MGESTHKSGKKNRKFGRAGRKPSHNRYNAEKRWEKNKARRIAKQQKKEAKKRAKKLALAQHNRAREVLK